MSFFGFDTTLPSAAKGAHQDENLAVYTWGSDGYDGLGDALQEGGDELNDETFGSAEPIGKDFDFSSTADIHRPAKQGLPQTPQYPTRSNDEPAKPAADIWGNKSASSLLRFPSSQRVEQTHQRKQSNPASHVVPTPATNRRHDIAIPTRLDAQGPLKPGPGLHENGNIQPDLRNTQPRTLAEIEAEMRAAAAAKQQQDLLERAQREAELNHRRMQEEQQNMLLEQVRREHERQIELNRRRNHSPLQDEYWNNQVPPIMSDPRQNHLHHASRGSGSFPFGVPPPHMPTPPKMMARPMQHQVPPPPEHILLQEVVLQTPPQIHPSHQYYPYNERESMMPPPRSFQENENMVERRRQRHYKMNSHSHKNDLMTQGDKDFITRVQLTQLITADASGDDFYAQVFMSRRGPPLGQGGPEGPLLKLAAGTGSGPQNSRGAPRRENAMQKMQARIERLVSEARKRAQAKAPEANKGVNPALENALGKTSARSYKAAPRQLLQVNTPELARTLSQEHKEEGSTSNPTPAGWNGHKQAPPPFTKKGGLLLIERLFARVLALENLRSQRPPLEDHQALEDWETKVKQQVEELWNGLKVSGPLYETNPHPFIALIAPLKGKRLIGRLSNELNANQRIMALSVLVNLMDQLDLVQLGPVLDSLGNSPEKRQAERQFIVFQDLVLNSALHLPPGSQPLSVYVGLLEVMIDDPHRFVKSVMTRPGLAILESLFAEATSLTHGIQGPSGEVLAPGAEELQAWLAVYSNIFDILEPHWLSLFPSTRTLTPPAFPFPPDSEEYARATLETDESDSFVWRFLAAFALVGTAEQHARLVQVLRGKIMGTLRMAFRMEDGLARTRKIKNTDLFLNAIGLDSSQIPGIY